MSQPYLTVVVLLQEKIVLEVLKQKLPLEGICRPAANEYSELMPNYFHDKLQIRAGFIKRWIVSACWHRLRKTTVVSYARRNFRTDRLFFQASLVSFCRNYLFIKNISGSEGRQYIRINLIREAHILSWSRGVNTKLILKRWGTWNNGGA